MNLGIPFQKDINYYDRFFLSKSPFVLLRFYSTVHFEEKYLVEWNFDIEKALLHDDIVAGMSLASAGIKEGQRSTFFTQAVV